MKLISCVVFVVSILTHSVVYAVTDDLVNEQEYFPLFLPSQDQLLQEKEYSSNYEESLEADILIEEIRIKQEVLFEAAEVQPTQWKTSVELILPPYMELPSTLPETWAR